MASITIPKKYRGSLVKVLSLSDEQFQALISNLKNTPFAFDFRPTLRNAAAAVEGVSADDVNSVADALFALYIASANSDKTEDQFIAGVVENISEDHLEELSSAGESPEAVTSRLRQLFEVEPLALAAKASSVMFEHDHIFSKARVLTDVRPIFGGSAEEAKALMIIHTLRIHYYHGDNHKDFFIALDTKDAQKLIDVLERAKAKAETLKAVLAGANVPYIEPE